MAGLITAIEATEDLVVPVVVGLVIVLIPASFVFIARTMRTLRHVEHSVIPWFRPPEPTPNDPEPEDKTLPAIVLRGEEERQQIAIEVGKLKDRLHEHMIFEENRETPESVLEKQFDRLRVELIENLKELRHD